MPLEVSLEKRAVRHLLAMGAMPVKRGQDGEPDREVLWGCCRHFWIEFKKEKTGKLRPGQKVMKKYLEGIGDLVYVVDSFSQIITITEWWLHKHGTPTAGRDAVFAG